MTFPARKLFLASCKTPLRWFQVVATGLMLCLSAHAEELAAAPEDDVDWNKEREFWSFQAPAAHPVPVVKNKGWPRQPLDHFILARLEEKPLAPSPEADKATLVRRLTFDLTGLPPTPQEAKAFMADRRPGAYERLVERLLSSKRFGERLASLWLPLARYAEDQAHQVGDDTKYFYPNAWRYREWVIDAFNRDLPYDRFVALQLAADKLEGANSPNLVALGFLGLGPKYYDRERLAVQADEWEDRVDTVCRALMGLTVSCARCHNHKFDPITMRDYYSLAGVFASTRMVNKTPAGAAQTGDAKAMSPETLHIVEDSDRIQDLPVFLRGNVDRKGPVSERRFLRVLSSGSPKALNDGSGRRDLAGEIANDRNPLTARVMVNRIWGQFFGRPLVVTPSNFGHSGQAPTHPGLLDDLAVRFMTNGWSVKALAREIVLSATYRQSSAAPASKAGADAANELLGHMSRRRLSIEQWRDSLLYVSGELDTKGGPSLELDATNNSHRTVYARVSRLKLNDLLNQFDYPDANVHAEKRNVTTTAMQKLFALNSTFMQDRAKALATTLIGQPRESDYSRITRAYQTLFAREPSREETKLGLEFLRQPARGPMPRWEQYTQLLLASNEMLYVD